MKIIALLGPADSGKTTTINLVYNKVLAAGGISTLWHAIAGRAGDFEAVVDFKGQKVAFYSDGDYANKTKDIIRKYDAAKVDVMICATNSRFSTTIPFISRFVVHHIINKTIATATLTEAVANDRDANKIFGLI
jgi:molybdopterin-guanine dinucleotide biosynthesis protein